MADIRMLGEAKADIVDNFHSNKIITLGRAGCIIILLNKNPIESSSSEAETSEDDGVHPEDLSGCS